MSNEQRDMMMKKAKEWLGKQLVPAFMEWVTYRNAGEPQNIKTEQTETSIKIGKKLLWKEPPITPAKIELDISPSYLSKPTSDVDYLYSVSLVISNQSVVGHIEFSINDEIKCSEKVLDILKWDKDQIKEQIQELSSKEY